MCIADLTDKKIKKAMTAFGKQVKNQTASRQDEVILKIRAEIERIRPQSDRLLHGKT
jgi:hypothetical protein